MSRERRYFSVCPMCRCAVRVVEVVEPRSTEIVVGRCECAPEDDMVDFDAIRSAMVEAPDALFTAADLMDEA